MISLPYPISTNRYWRNNHGRVVTSKEAADYKRTAAMAARYAGFLTPLSGPVEVVVQFHPKLTRKGVASKQRLDIDNVIKVTLDALNNVTYIDDNQVERLSVELAKPIDGGGLSVWVAPIAEVVL